jgi:hypothetical protein
MRFLILASLLSLAVTGARAHDSVDEQITAAALRTYFEQSQGGTAIAFPEQRRPILLANRTITPSRAQRRVSMFSRENDAMAAKFNRLRSTLLADLVVHSRHTAALKVDLPHFKLMPARRGKCGPHASRERYSDAVAVSRPGLSPDGNEALLYVEYDGGGCAYDLKRTNGTWTVAWRVELWACG